MNKKLRSRAARKGRRTRRANERKRSAAARKGWRTRRANERERKARKEPSRLRQFLVTVKYTKRKKFRRLDYLVNAESREEALSMVRKEMKLTGQAFSKWQVEVTENPDARPRRKSIEVN